MTLWKLFIRLFLTLDTWFMSSFASTCTNRAQRSITFQPLITLIILFSITNLKTNTMAFFAFWYILFSMSGLFDYRTAQGPVLFSARWALEKIHTRLLFGMLVGHFVIIVLARPVTLICWPRFTNCLVHWHTHTVLCRCSDSTNSVAEDHPYVLLTLWDLDPSLCATWDP